MYILHANEKSPQWLTKSMTDTERLLIATDKNTALLTAGRKEVHRKPSLNIGVSFIEFIWPSISSITIFA